MNTIKHKFFNIKDSTENNHKLLRGKKCKNKFKKKGKLLFYFHSIVNNDKQQIGARGRDRMVVGFIANYAISAYHH